MTISQIVKHLEQLIEEGTQEVQQITSRINKYPHDVAKLTPELIQACGKISLAKQWLAAAQRSGGFEQPDLMRDFLTQTLMGASTKGSGDILESMLRDAETATAARFIRQQPQLPYYTSN